MSEYRNWSNDVNVSEQQEEAAFSLVKVFSYMFAGLLITTIVMLGLGGLFRHLFGIGDAFAERNKYALEIDYELEPPLFEVSPTHFAATWLLHPNAPKVEPPKIIKDRIARMKKEAEQL